MASEGPFEVEANTAGLWLLNGADIAAAGNDEGTNGYDLSVEDLAPVYGENGYGQDAHSDTSDEGIGLTATGSSDTSRRLINTSNTLSFTQMTVEVISKSATWSSEGWTAAGIIGTALYSGGYNRGWGIYFDPGTPKIAWVCANGTYHDKTITGLTVADWKNEWIYFCGRYDNTDGDSSGKYGYLNAGILSTDANTTAHNNEGSGWDGTDITTTSSTFMVGSFLFNYPSRAGLQTISVAHVINEFKSDAWVESRFDAIKAVGNWGAGGGGGIQPYTMHHLNHNCNKDDTCGLIKPTDREVITINSRRYDNVL